jgi:ketosteroid isomerase-like protein
MLSSFAKKYGSVDLMRMIRHVTIAATLLALLGLGGCGSMATSDKSSNDSRAADIAQLTRQADAWDQAIVRKDLAGITGNMAEDFRQIDGDADIETKASFGAGLVSPKLTINPYTVEDLEVRLYGDVALLSGRTRMTGSYDGKAFASHYRYIDVYVRSHGAWKISSVQITKMPQ